MWLLHQEDKINEFDKKPFFWPEDWKSHESNGWLKWHPKFLGETKWEEIAR